MSAVPISRARPTSRYGWLIVAALSITATISYGILSYSFTVFVEPMRVDLGWSKAEITGAYSAMLLVAGLSAAMVGRWIDRVSVRRLMTAGSIAAAALVAGWSVVGSVPLFYLIWIGLGLASGAVFYEPAFALIFRWFTVQRSRALTLLTFVGGFASVIFIPLAGALVEAAGWRAAAFVLAVILAATIPIHALILRDASPVSAASAGPPVRQTTPAEAYRRPAFWWLTAAFTCSLFVVAGMAVHLVPYLIGAGYAPAVAAGIGGVIGLVALPGRLIFTPLGARVSRHTVAALLFVLQALGLLALNVVPGDAGVWAFVLLYGAGFGAITPARAQLVAEMFGAAHYGAISGRMTQIGSLFRAAAPVSISLLFGLTGSYTAVVYALALVALLAAFGVLRAGRG